MGALWDALGVSPDRRRRPHLSQDSVLPSAEIRPAGSDQADGSHDHNSSDDLNDDEEALPGRPLRGGAGVTSTPSTARVLLHAVGLVYDCKFVRFKWCTLHTNAIVVAGSTETASSRPSKRPRSPPAVPICRHGRVTVRVCRQGINQGKSFFCCRLPRNDPDRYDDAFIWLEDTIAGQQVVADLANAAHSGSHGESGSSRVRPPQAALSAPQRPLAEATMRVVNAVSAPAVVGSMLQRLQASQQAASARRGAGRDACENAQLAQVFDQVRRLR